VRWDTLISLAQDALAKLLERAPRFPRNLILDQTNVFASARSRKMRGFQAYRRVAVVLVPEEGELEERTRVRVLATGKEVPQDAVIEMKGEQLLRPLQAKGPCYSTALPTTLLRNMLRCPLRAGTHVAYPVKTPCIAGASPVLHCTDVYCTVLLCVLGLANPSQLRAPADQGGGRKHGCPPEPFDEVW